MAMKPGKVRFDMKTGSDVLKKIAKDAKAVGTIEPPSSAFIVKEKS